MNDETIVGDSVGNAAEMPRPNSCWAGLIFCFFSLRLLFTATLFDSTGH